MNVNVGADVKGEEKGTKLGFTKYISIFDLEFGLDKNPVKIRTSKRRRAFFLSVFCGDFLYAYGEGNVTFSSYFYYFSSNSCSNS